MFRKVVKILLLLGCSVLTGCSHLLRGFMDFPCFVRYDEAGRCLNVDNTFVNVPDAAEIEVFLTTYSADFSGGGCHHEAVGSGRLSVDTAVGTLSLERSGETLLVNGSPLAPGETYTERQAFSFDIWETASLEIQNLGVVGLCGRPEAAPRLLVVGSYGTRLTLLRGAAVTLFLLAALILLIRSLRRKAAKP
jgi:hypothetical protein